LVRRIAPDLLHAHYLTSNGLVAAATGFHPLVVSARGSDVHQSMGNRGRRALIRLVMARADLVNPVSAELAGLVGALGVPAAKTLCLTQGIERTPFAAVERVPAADGVVRMICTRKLHAPYQPETIVAALALLKARGLEFRFTFAASGRDETAVRDLVEAQGLGARVRFLGGYPPEALPSLLAGADVYVSASLWDGTSPALLEAMAAGIYPVVTDCPANREWLSGDGDGRLFGATDVEQLAACLADAAQRRDHWPAAASRNRRIVAERADRETNMRIIGTHYDRLVKEHGRRSGPA
jgi:glycosyltransferase involved in cell wall biosynthesis